MDIETDKETGLPNTFVPGRNILFLTVASIVAYQKKKRRDCHRRL